MHAGMAENKEVGRFVFKDVSIYKVLMMGRI